MRYCLCLIIGMPLLYSVSFLAAQEPERNEPIPLRILRGQELAEAREARNEAGLAWEALKVRFYAARRQEQVPDASQAILLAECPPILEAYQEVVDTYPHTEIASDCIGRMGAIYDMTYRHDMALELELQRAVEFAGTFEGANCDYALGRDYLVRIKNPEEALKWLARVPPPLDGGVPVNSALPRGVRIPNEVMEWNRPSEISLCYYNAQKSMIKCELRLGQDDKAEERFSILNRMYPGENEDLDRSLEYERRSILSAKESGRVESPEELSPHLQELERQVWATIAPPWTPEEALREAREFAKTIEGRVLALGRWRHSDNQGRDQAIDSLAEYGDKAVAAIEKISEDQSLEYSGEYRAINVLRAINSEKSRALLLRFGLGELSDANHNHNTWAASRLLECDPTEAWSLLESTSNEVVMDALSALTDTPVDVQQMASLKKCLDRQDPEVDYRVVRVMAFGCTDELALEALASMTNSLAAVADLPNINDERRRSHGGTLTIGESYYQEYKFYLMNLQVDIQHLREQAQRLEEGAARDLIHIVLAYKEDASTHDDIIAIIQNKEAGMFRAWAVVSLQYIGDLQDVGLLKQLEADDPFVIQRQDHFGPNIVDFYPVRSAARGAIVVIEGKYDESASE
jgi:hypothetical protein